MITFGGGGGGSGRVLGDRALAGGLGISEAPGEGGLDVLGRRGGREGALKESPARSGPGRGGGDPRWERTGPTWSSSVRIRAGPGVGTG